MSPLTTRTLRSALLLLVAFGVLLFSLVACKLVVSDHRAANTDTANIPTSLMSAAARATASPTPAFPPFTIGVWPSDMAPAAHDGVTIYVICRIQDPTMTHLAQPAAGQQVRVNILGDAHRSYTVKTNSEGMAAVHVTISATHPGVPILVEAVTRWHGADYRGQTSFTPAPDTGRGTSVSGGTGSSATPAPVRNPTPTPPPAPKPTPPPKPTPTPKPVPAPTATAALAATPVATALPPQATP